MTKIVNRRAIKGNIKGDTLAHEVRETSRVFSRDHGVKVMLGGQMAGVSVDAKTIVLPSIPMGAEFTPEEVSVTRGYVDHEAGHKRHTDFGLLKQGKPWQKKCAKYPALHGVFNALEDVRIEGKIIEDYPGAAMNLRATAENVGKRYLEKHADTDAVKQLGAVLPLAITWAGREAMNYNSLVFQDCLKSLEDGFADIAENVMQAALDPEATTESMLEHAMEVIETLGMDYTAEELEDAKSGKTTKRGKTKASSNEGGQGDGDAGEDAEGEDGEDGEGEGQGKGEGEGEDAEGEGDGNEDDGVMGGEGTGLNGDEDQMFDDDALTADGGGKEIDKAEAKAHIEGRKMGKLEDAAEDTSGTRSGVQKSKSLKSLAGKMNGKGHGGSAGGASDVYGIDPVESIKSGVDEVMSRLSEDKGAELNARSDGKWGKPDHNGRTVEHYEAPAAEIDAYVTRHMAQGRFGTEPMHRGNEMCAKYLEQAATGARNGRYYDRLKAGTATETNKMRKKIERALLSMKERVWRGGHEDGALDPRALAKAMTGRENVYRKKGMGEDFDTAVLICVDASGSMQGKKDVAQQSLIALSEVLDRIGVPFAVTAWNTDSLCVTDGTHGVEFAGHGSEVYDNYRKAGREAHNAAHEAGKGRPSHLRLQPVTVYELKSFEDNLKVAQPYIAGYGHLVGSGNTDADSILNAYNRLLKDRPEKRKVMLVLSDGATCGTTFHDDDVRLKYVCEQLENECEMIGIGVLDESVKEYYTNWVVCQSLDELAGACMDPIVKMLTGQKVTRASLAKAQELGNAERARAKAARKAA